jgi:hypothetical protein
VACTCALAACLPAGAPPAGRHLVHDRTLSGVFLSPSEQDGVSSYLLATGPVRNLDLPAPPAGESVADVYAFVDSAPVVTREGLAGMAPLFDNLKLPATDPPDYTFATDSLGRLLAMRFNPATQPTTWASFELWRFDVGIGSGEYLSWVSPATDLYQNPDPRLGARPFMLSPGRTQVFMGESGSGYLIGPTDRHSLWQVNEPVFVGEDFYCAGIVSVDPNAPPLPLGTNIIRVKPGGTPEILLSSTGYLGLAAIEGDFTPQLVLTLYTEQGAAPFALLDTESLAPRDFPSGKGQAQFVSASSDGRLLLFQTTIAANDPAQPADHWLFVYDWGANRFDTLDSYQLGKLPSGQYEWRPGTHELWLGTLPGGFAIWQQELGVRTFSPPLLRVRARQRGLSSFTRDGRHWFSKDAGVRPSLSVGSADDPSAELLPLNPSGTEVYDYWQLDDGRFLVEAWASNYQRDDIYLVDADAGTTRAIATAGHLVATGQSRALALLNWQVSRSSGDLTLVDYASGAHTVLAQDVYAVDVDRGQSAAVPAGTDVLLPGTRVAFLSRNRLLSRDDGLWVAELP